MTTRIHIIHAGNMNNKGTQALLSSDVLVLREIVKNELSISVSTTDVEGVKRLNLPIAAVLPTLLDVPYEKADRLTKRFRIPRSSVKYKVFAVYALLLFFAQTMLTLASLVLRKLGLPGIYRKEIFERIRESDLVLSCSDENFKETASLLPLNVYWILTWWSMLFERTVEILVAKSLGKPIVMLPNSVGPFRTWIGRFLSRLSLNKCSAIIVRDPISYGIVETLGINCRKYLTSDMALLFKPRKKEITESVDHPIIGVCPGIYSFSVSKHEIGRYVTGHARALDAAIEKHGVRILFLPHYVSGFEYDDFEISQLILESMKNKEHARILKANSLDDFKLMINQMDIVVSSKMHPAVLAVSGYVPAISVVYDHKQTGFFKDLGLSEYTVRLQHASRDELSSKIDKAWSDRKEIVGLLKARVPQLQETVRNTVKIAIAPFVNCK